MHFDRRQLLRTSGAGLVLGSVAIARQLWAAPVGVPTNLMDRLPREEWRLIEAGLSRYDAAPAFQNMIDNGLAVRLPESGSVLFRRTITLRSGSNIIGSGPATLRQATQGASLFAADRAVDIVLDLNQVRLVGPGGWLADWHGNQGREGYRGVSLRGCIGPQILGGEIVNWANAGIGIVGGRAFAIVGTLVRGTHTASTPLPWQANYQNGIYVANDPVFGSAEGGRVAQCSITGVGQGLLRENLPGAPNPAALTTISDLHGYDIPGQHLLYNQDGNLLVERLRGERIGLSLFKTQSADAGTVLMNIVCHDAVGHELGNALFEIATLGDGFIRGVSLQGSASDTGYLAAFNGPMAQIECSVSGSAIRGNAIYCQGRSQTALKIQVDAKGVGQDGVVITSTGSTIDLTAKIDSVNTSGTLRNSDGKAAGTGILIAEGNARKKDMRATRVRLINPSVRSVNQKMGWAIRTTRPQSSIEIVGKPTIVGAVSPE